MSPVSIGVEIEIVEERRTLAAPVSTDPLFLVHSDVPAAATYTDLGSARAAFTSAPDLVAIADAYFNEGGRVLHVAPVVMDGEEPPAPDVAASLAAWPADMGPGQVVAPEFNTGPDMNTIAEWAWTTNRIYIGDGPAGANDAALQALVTPIRAGDGARFASLAADTLDIPGGANRTVPASVVQAALMARNDIATGNPGLAAAGAPRGQRGDGECRYAIGITDERGEASRNTLAEYGVNCFRSVYGNVRNYGFRTCADLDDHPVWWDLSGSRTMMAIRAREAAVAEAHLFGQVDAAGAFLASYESSLARELSELQRIGAIFGTDTDPGYTVRAGWDVNPREDVAQGIVRAYITVRLATFAEQIHLSIVRRPITEGVA